MQHVATDDLLIALRQTRMVWYTGDHLPTVAGMGTVLRLSTPGSNQGLNAGVHSPNPETVK